ncbi:hypothetical protein [Muribaculum intestinale]|jgi:hypothetical protein|uniref:hypothetical protein n=1 Tax=Muribaculum intestinale TaxID=1796646 RepID=UPI0025B44ACD|nr:hypothetical protein [Muribaculum intestinale]
MRKISIVFLTLISMSGFKVQAYEPAGDRIMTKWGEDIDPSSVWEEYPRPIMERSEWQNLNGLWEYAITGKDATAPKDWQGEILVPFCAESSLSGVGRNRNHISNLKISPDIDNNTLTVKVQSEGDNKHYITEVSVKDNGRIIASGKALPGESATVKPAGGVALGFLIDKPSAVRYNWADYPDGNLYGENNLPVLPFASDIK